MLEMGGGKNYAVERAVILQAMFSFLLLPSFSFSPSSFFSSTDLFPSLSKKLYSNRDCLCLSVCPLPSLYLCVCMCMCVSFETVSLYNPSLPGTYYVSKATHEFIVIDLLLPPKSWS